MCLILYKGVKIMTKKLKYILLTFLITFIFININVCKKEEKKDNSGLGLLLLLQQSQTNESSGFMILIPEGVAK